MAAARVEAERIRSEAARVRAAAQADAAAAQQRGRDAEVATIGKDLALARRVSPVLMCTKS